MNNDGDTEIPRIQEVLRRAGLSDTPIHELKAAVILNAMNACDGDRDRAAHMLGISVERLNEHLDQDGPA